MDDQAVDVFLAGLYDKGKRVLNDDNFEDGSDEDDDIDVDVGGFDTKTDDEDETEDDKYKNNRNPKKKLPRFQEFRSESDMRHVTFKLGLSFPNPKIFKEAIREYAIREGKDIYFKKDEEKHVRAECKDKGCSWVYYASILGPKCLPSPRFSQDRVLDANGELPYMIK